MKKEILFVTFLLTIGSSLVYTQTANALTIGDRVRLRGMDANSATISGQARLAARTALKKTNAINEIDRRLSSLNNIITKIEGLGRLSSDQKNTLTTQVQNEINNLNNLKTEIQAETDPTALQTEKTSIIQSYRVYALFVPQVEIIAQADKIMDISDAMSGKTTDTTLLGKISDAKNQAQNAINSVLPLTPDGYPGNRSTLISARDMLKTARTELNSVYSTLKAKSSTPTVNP